MKSRISVLGKECEKPCPSGLDKILADYQVFPQEAIFVGDSLAKDGMVAASRGIKFVWAHYGHHLPAEYEELIHYSLKPEGSDTQQKLLPAPLITAVAARYDELLKHI
jgi:FMN phosphatase YigB (HAD superfamily)